MRRFRFFTAAVIGCICSAASAQSVRINTYQASSSSPFSSTTVSSGSAINLSVDYQISRVCIFTDGGGSSANVGAVSISHTGGTSRSSELQVILMDRAANLSFPSEGTDLSPVGTNWAGISFDTGTASWGTVSGSITGNLTGAVSANKIVRVEIGGQASAAISANGTGTAIGWVEVGSSTSAGTITANNGNIDYVKGTSSIGTISGAVSCGGHLLQVATLGAISITGSTGISAASGIDSIVAGYDDGTPHWKDITSVIDADSDSDVGLDGLLGYLECNDFTGTIHAAEFGQYDPAPPLSMKVHGDFDGAISVRDGVFSQLQVLGAYSSTSTIEIGGLLSDIIYAGGDLPSVIVHGDFTDTGPGTPELALYIWSGGTLGYVQVDGSAYTIYAAYPHVRFFGTDGVGEIHIGGDLEGHVSGPISAPTIPVGTITVGGSAALNLDASTIDVIDVHGDLVATDSQVLSIAEFGSGSAIRVGGTMDEPIICGGPGHTASLKGQIILNGNNTSDTWDSTVSWYDGSGYLNLATANSQPYKAEWYEVTSVTMGSGSVGLVPFALHFSDCAPANGDTVCEIDTRDWPESPETRETMVLPFYGHVYDSLTGDAYLPVKIERQSMLCGSPCPPSWVDISSACLAIAGAGDGREVWVCMAPVGGSAVPFDQVYNYRITPRVVSSVTDLRSDDTFASPTPNVVSFTYTVTVICGNRAERSEASTVPSPSEGDFYTVADLEFLLTLDFNNDSITDEEDALILFAALGL